MHYQFHFRPYRRPFRQPVITSHGVWALREGMILRLVNATGQVGWGEIAPIPWFGSETLEQALAFCHQLPAVLTDDRLCSIPETLPCCQFAFESAWEDVREPAIDQTEPQRRRDAENQASFAAENSTFQAQNSDIAALNSRLRLQNSNVVARNSNVAAQNSELRPQSSNVAAQNSERQAHNPALKRCHLSQSPSPLYSTLLPAGNAALHTWKALWANGFQTFKWKIGVKPIAAELEILHGLTRSLPNTAKLRLDANGGLSTTDAIQWLETCDAIAANSDLPVTLEYIEQPLPIAQFQVMQDLSQRHTTPIALDESVATLSQLRACYKNGWRGVFVIKPAIVGSPSQLRQFCQTHTIDAVFSSAFETVIGRHAGLKLAAALGNPDRALGYGTTHWFNDAEPDVFGELGVGAGSRE